MDTFAAFIEPDSLVCSTFIDYADDPEMRAKLADRRAVFGDCEFIREPHDLTSAVAGGLNARPATVVWVDSLAIWVSNLMLRANTQWRLRAPIAGYIRTELAQLLEWSRQAQLTLHLVGADVDYDFAARSDSAALYQYLLYQLNKFLYSHPQVATLWHTNGITLALRNRAHR